MDVGQMIQYRHKHRGQELLVDAKILRIDARQITIEFMNADGRHIQRVLRQARDRARIVGYMSNGPGAPIGNQNATRVIKRIGITASLSGKRLHHVLRRLEEEGKPNTRKEQRNLVYRAIDAYVDKHSTKGEQL